MDRIATAVITGLVATGVAAGALTLLLGWIMFWGAGAWWCLEHATVHAGLRGVQGTMTLDACETYETGKGDDAVTRTRCSGPFTPAGAESPTERIVFLGPAEAVAEERPQPVRAFEGEGYRTSAWYLAPLLLGLLVCAAVSGLPLGFTLLVVTAEKIADMAPDSVLFGVLIAITVGSGLLAGWVENLVDVF